MEPLHHHHHRCHGCRFVVALCSYGSYGMRSGDRLVAARWAGCGMCDRKVGSSRYAIIRKAFCGYAWESFNSGYFAGVYFLPVLDGEPPLCRRGAMLDKCCGSWHSHSRRAWSGRLRKYKFSYTFSSILCVCFPGKLVEVQKWELGWPDPAMRPTWM